MNNRLARETEPWAAVGVRMQTFQPLVVGSAPDGLQSTSEVLFDLLLSIHSLLQLLFETLLVVVRLTATASADDRAGFTPEDDASVPLREVLLTEHCPAVGVIAVELANCELSAFHHRHRACQMAMGRSGYSL